MRRIARIGERSQQITKRAMWEERLNSRGRFFMIFLELWPSEYDV